MTKPRLMTQKDASRIQSAEARGNAGKVTSGGFASRAQSTADRRAHEAKGNHGPTTNVIPTPGTTCILQTVVTVLSSVAQLIEIAQRHFTNQTNVE